MNQSDAAIAKSFSGWRSAFPVDVRLSRAEVLALRNQIAKDLERLLPRCEALEISLTEAQRGHRGYVASKQRRSVTHDLIDSAPAEMRRLTAGAALDLPHAQPAAGADSRAPAMLFPRQAPLLAVGGVFGPQLRVLVDEARTTRVAPGSGEPVATVSGAERPSPASLSGWLARADEQDRARLVGILLGRDSGRADVELLRRRVHPHHRVLVEPGSAAVPWMFSLWGGTVTRHGDILAFSEPGREFREPSTMMTLPGGAPWPRISVVTVSFNQRNFIERCLASVLDQCYPNLEYIVVDAVSNDGSLDILERYRSRLSHLIVERDEGQSDGLNKGFGHATGDILCWVNSDDMLAPTSLRRAALAFAQTGADIVAGTCSRIAGSDECVLMRHHSVLPAEGASPFRLAGPLNWCDNWEKGDYFFQPEVFFTRDIWQRSGGYVKDYLYWAMDWDLWLRFALAGATAVRIPDVLGVSREHAAQKTTADEMYLWQVVGILREFDDLLASLQDARR